MFAIQYLALPGAILAIVNVVRPQRWTRWATAAAIALVLATGAYGTFDGRSRTDRGIEMWAHESSAADLEAMRRDGYAEAMRPIQFAGVVAAALAVLFAAGELRRRLKR